MVTFDNPLEVGHDLLSVLRGLLLRESADKFAEGSPWEFDLVGEREDAAPVPGLDGPSLVIRFQEVSRGHAEPEYPVRLPLRGLEVEVELPLTRPLLPVEGGPDPLRSRIDVIELLEHGEPLLGLVRLYQVWPYLLFHTLSKVV